jgi:uncharacterized protein YfaS (alpha-2-macroglobulin family)
MSVPRSVLFLAGAAIYLVVPPTPLGVLRVSPTGDAERNATISITFDRPVAGSLDRTVDPARLVHVEPEVAGTIEWRDPVTITISPRELLRPDTRYTVTVSPDFAAMDGSRLERAYRFSFRVKGPTLITSSLARGPEWSWFLTPASRFALVYSAPVDLALLSATAYLRLGPECTGERTVRLRALSQRRLDKSDSYLYRSYVPRVDSLRRVVQLAPQTPLPLACSGELFAPTELAAGRTGSSSWTFSTYGPFRLAKVDCAERRYCPTGPLVAHFSTPVRGAEVMRRVRLLPEARFTVRDTSAESSDWVLEAELEPRVAYAVVADTGMRDVFGQRLRGNPASAFRTTGYEPSVAYQYGRTTVEKSGFGTLAVQHVNVDTLAVTVAAIPDSLEGQFMRRAQWNLGDLWGKVRGSATTTRVPVHARRDRPAVTGVRLPALVTGAARHPALLAVEITSNQLDPDTSRARFPTIAIIQVTDLGVHAKIGAESGVVWVTGVHDGKARAGAQVTLMDYAGRAVASATTNASGIATFPGYRALPPARSDSTDVPFDDGFEGYVVATLGADRALAGVSQYDPDLGPWNFKVSSAYGAEREPVAGAVFTERGIYRPGEMLYAKAIMRTGQLGALAVPGRGDSLRWVFRDRDQGTLADTVVALSTFGTAEHTLQIPAGAPLGTYGIQIRARRHGRWIDVAWTDYRVAEYRPPEFLVDLSTDTTPRFPGDSLRARVEARYLFGAPMARAQITWQLRESPISSWALEIPNTDGYFLGESGWWWEDGSGESSVRVVASGVDTLDASGALTLRARLPEPRKGRAARVTMATSVEDVNRQAVGSSASVTVHPASFYVAAKPLGEQFFWAAGTRQSIGVIAVRPTGERVRGITVHGTVARREWHEVHRERNGVAELVGEWVIDTVGRCTVTTGTEPATCSVTPPAGGTYIVTFRARDERGREARTTFYRWASGTDWVPWNDESQFKVDVIADKTRYTVGDTATVLFASPFTNAEAWITVEREGLIEQRRMTLTSGSTTLKFPITEAYAPNAYVGIFIVRGRSAPPGRLDDPGRPTIRVGYTELRVTPEVKRLTVAVEPLAKEYRPGDTARVSLAVRDGRGMPQRAEVTLWAVDEGVLALTGYRTPDPIDLLYRERGLGLRLASNMANVAPQIPEGEKGRRAPGGGGGADRSDVLRSRFKSTAFFLGSVVTGPDGKAVASAKLPDNLTTFRVMAVAVTAGDRYGSGQSSMLVTRPLVARAALPRFVRRGDAFTAGAVVNQRAPGSTRVAVKASATGIELRGDPSRSATLDGSKGVEVRFPFRAVAGDSATFRFTATANGSADGVQVSVPVRPDFHPRAFTVSGVLHDTATAELVLPAGIDPARSRVTFSLGASPLAMLRGVSEQFRVYPYYCTEQVTSLAMPLLALERSRGSGTAGGKGDGAHAGRDARGDIRRAVEVISSRQRTDGGIGFWSASDWTSPWLSAYAGRFLLDAKRAGFAVSDSVLARLTGYLSRTLHEPSEAPPRTPVANWYETRATVLSDRVASVDFLSRAGHADVPAEDQLLASAAQLRWEDRLLLAEVLASRGARSEALSLVQPAWNEVRVEGNRAVLPARAHEDFYFASRTRPVARLLTATLVLDPTHPLIGPMVETLAQQGGSAERGATWIWSTQDAGALAEALAAYDAHQKAAAAHGIRVRAGGRTLFVTHAAGTAGATGAPHDSGVALSGLLRDAPNGAKRLVLSLDMPGAAAGKAGEVAYYYITVREVPLERPVTPFDQGVQVERWYERYERPTPIVSAVEGELVRVRLRVTVSAERHFLVLDDALPAGLEAVDLSLRTAAALPGPGAGAANQPGEMPEGEGGAGEQQWWYGSWDAGWWSPWDHRELRDDRVVYVATMLWPGTYTATYVARATTPGVFVRPPAHAEEMYNPAVNGRSDGGVFTVTEKP